MSRARAAGSVIGSILLGLLALAVAFYLFTAAQIAWDEHSHRLSCLEYGSRHSVSVRHRSSDWSHGFRCEALEHGRWVEVDR